MPNNKLLFLLGYASGIAGAETGSADGPYVMQQSPHLASLTNEGIEPRWCAMIKTPAQNPINKLAIVTDQCTQLAQAVIPLVKEKKMFIVIAGDHTSAIGTWSGVSSAIKEKGSIGLIWIDAHMDSNTPETTKTGNLHGMPLACLLGHGDDSLVKLIHQSPKLKPEHVCLIGVRSYDPGEADLLNKLNVRVFYMEEIKQRGLDIIMNEAIQHVSKNTIGYGVSIDIDSMDPADAPGTGVREKGGIAANELCRALTKMAHDPRLIAAEIAEFDPHRDHDHVTEKWIARLITAITIGKM